ncbi:MAG: hypothetical protein V4541_03840 [Bacteroidota bacterium]
MLCNLYINHWISKTWNVEGFAIYNLIKRISSFLAFPLLIGAGIGIPRYISFLKKDVKNNSFEYLLAGSCIFISSLLLFTALTFLFPSVFLKVFEQTQGNKNTILWCMLFFVGSQGLYVLVNAYYRGLMQFGIMSLLNVLLMSVIPLLVLFYAGNIFDYFYGVALFSLFMLLGILVFIAFKSVVSIRAIQIKSIRLFKYGYPRIVAELGLFAIELMPIYLIGVYIGLKESGYLSMCFLLIKLAAMIYELAGSLVLPYFGKLYKNSSSTVFIKAVNQLLTIGFLGGIVIAFGFYLLIPFVIDQFFPALITAIAPAQYLFIVFPIYAVYLLLRNILDIVLEKAYNSINLSIVFVVQLIVLAIGFHFKNFMIYTVLAVAIPYLILGILTFLVWTNRKQTI